MGTRFSRYGWILGLGLAIGAGFWVWRARWTSPSPATVRVLCGESWIDEKDLRAFALSRGIHVELFTYRRVSELLRQIANADGRVDVLCVSSLLIRNFAKSGWVSAARFDALENAKNLAPDFIHLPYDPDFTLGVPLLWTGFGFASARPVPSKWSELVSRGRVGVWGTALNVIALLTSQGVAFDDRLEAEDPRGVARDVTKLLGSVGLIAPDFSATAADTFLKRYEVVHVPQVTVPAGTGYFRSGDDGGIVDVTLLAIGSRAAEPNVARALIDELIEPSRAVARAAATGLGTPLRQGEGEARLKPSQRPSALRNTPLTALRFPDVSAEATLKFSNLIEKP